MMKKLGPFVVLFLVAFSYQFYPESLSTAPVTLSAFPGAEGFGAMTSGGRGGGVIEVTNLNDDGPGSLRACIEASGPRYCVFRVAGTIEVESRIDIWDPYITIAGQTAPGGGITLKNAPSNSQAPLAIRTHDVVIRYIRSRPGPSSQPSAGVDAITILNQEDDDHLTDGVYNIVIDHASFSWGVDEVVNTAFDIHDVTIQWSIISEGLDCSSHPDGCHSKGALLGSEGATNISFHHNLMAHNLGRNPSLDTSGLVDLVNNVLYVPDTIVVVIRDRYGAIPVNLVGNYTKTALADPDGRVFTAQDFTNSSGASIYVEGNIDPNRTTNSQDEALAIWPDSRQFITDTRHSAPSVTTTSAFEAYDQVLALAGATQGLDEQGSFFWRRDTVDERVVSDTRNGTGGVIDDPSEVGGWPELETGMPYVDSDHDGMADTWELIHFETLDRGSPTDSSGDFDGDGYTDLEEFLNGTDPGTVPSDGPGDDPGLPFHNYLPVILYYP